MVLQAAEAATKDTTSVTKSASKTSASAVTDKLPRDQSADPRVLKSAKPAVQATTSVLILAGQASAHAIMEKLPQDQRAQNMVPRSAEAVTKDTISLATNANSNHAPKKDSCKND